MIAPCIDCRILPSLVDSPLCVACLVDALEPHAPPTPPKPAILFRAPYAPGQAGYVVRVRPCRFVVVERSWVLVYALDASDNQIGAVTLESIEMLDAAVIKVAQAQGARGYRNARLACEFVMDTRALFGREGGEHGD